MGRRPLCWPTPWPAAGGVGGVVLHGPSFSPSAKGRPPTRLPRAVLTWRFSQCGLGGSAGRLQAPGTLPSPLPPDLTQSLWDPVQIQFGPGLHDLADVDVPEFPFVGAGQTKGLFGAA